MWRPSISTRTWAPSHLFPSSAVVAELRHLARLHDRFRRSAAAGHIPWPNPSAPPLREAVVPYEAALDDLQRQLQSKQAEVDSLKEKLPATTASRRNGHRNPSKQASPGGAPTAELFTSCAEQACATTRAFAAPHLTIDFSPASRVFSSSGDGAAAGGGAAAEQLPSEKMVSWKKLPSPTEKNRNAGGGGVDAEERKKPMMSPSPPSVDEIVDGQQVMVDGGEEPWMI